MKKMLSIMLALILCLGLTAAVHADDPIKVGIINLDPAESGYLQFGDAIFRKLLEIAAEE